MTGACAWHGTYPVDGGTPPLEPCIQGEEASILGNDKKQGRSAQTWWNRKHFFSLDLTKLGTNIISWYPLPAKALFELMILLYQGGIWYFPGGYMFLWSFTPHSSKKTKLFDFPAWIDMKKSSKVNDMKSTKYDNWRASAIDQRKPPNIKLRGKNIAINGPSKYIKCLPFGRFFGCKRHKFTQLGRCCLSSMVISCIFTDSIFMGFYHPFSPPLICA